jgi:hypothetical protein
MNILQIGTIDITCDKIIACDPCRKDTDEVWYNTVIENVLPGKYIAEVTMFDNEESNGWGDRVAELTIRHSDYDLPKYKTTEKITDTHTYMGYVGVDSGQAMFANLDKRKQLLEKSQDDDDFYWKACDATESKNQAGIVDNTVVSSSGYGDGCYDVYVAYNEDGKVVAASIEFIDEEGD